MDPSTLDMTETMIDTVIEDGTLKAQNMVDLKTVPLTMQLLLLACRARTVNSSREDDMYHRVDVSLVVQGCSSVGTTSRHVARLHVWLGACSRSLHWHALLGYTMNIK